MIISFILWLRFNYGHTKSETHGAVARIKWKDLVTFYRSNPNRWSYEKVIKNDCYALLSTTKKLLFNSGPKWQSIYDHRYCHSDKIIRIQLSYFDFLKFQFHRIFMSKKSASEGLEMILSAVQEDIQSLQKIANEQINEANNDMKEIEEKLKEQRTLQI